MPVAFFTTLLRLTALPRERPSLLAVHARLCVTVVAAHPTRVTRLRRRRRRCLPARLRAELTPALERHPNRQPTPARPVAPRWFRHRAFCPSLHGSSTQMSFTYTSRAALHFGFTPRTSTTSVVSPIFQSSFLNLGYFQRVMRIESRSVPSYP